MSGHSEFCVRAASFGGEGCGYKICLGFQGLELMCFNSACFVGDLDAAMGVSRPDR